MNSPRSLKPPVAKQTPHRLPRPTGPVSDPYAWLANRDDEDTITYLEAENAYTAAWFEPHHDLTEAIFGEIRSRTQETDTGAPVPIDDYFYVSSTRQGESYPIYSRGPTAATATEQTLLDINVEAADHDYFDLGIFDVSPDHQMLAWSADLQGDEHYSIHFRDLTTGSDRAEIIHHTTYAGSAWSADGRYLFYVEADEQERPYRVLRHELGTQQSNDVEVFRDDDQRFFVAVGLTRNQQAIIIHTASKQTAEVHLIAADDPTAAPQVVIARQDGHEYQVDHWGDRLVIVTNHEAVDFRVVTAPLDDPANWTELVPHQPARRITTVEAFADFLALHEWNQAQEQIRIVRRDGTSTVLAIDPEPHEVGFGPNEQWDTDTLRLQHQSLTVPPRVIDVTVASGSVVVIKRHPTPNVELDHYVATRYWAPAPDSTAVPVDVVRHRDTPIDGTAPGTIYGYGSYEVSLAPWFSIARLSLLDRGHIWALVHPRGGGELGRQWYLDGKLDHKRNTFTDTLAATQYLVDIGVVAPDRIALRGGSAGGLLVGACITMQPELFAAAIAEVPFVDVVTTMSDPSLPLTVTEWEEWGDPRVEPFASYIASYSPYDNTAAADYPALYVSAGLNDPRVSYHEPAKWVARLRHVGTGTRPVLLKTELGAGHAGRSGRYDTWRDEAQVLAFTLVTLDPNTTINSTSNSAMR